MKPNMGLINQAGFQLSGRAFCLHVQGPGVVSRSRRQNKEQLWVWGPILKHLPGYISQFQIGCPYFPSFHSLPLLNRGLLYQLSEKPKKKKKTFSIRKTNQDLTSRITQFFTGVHTHIHYCSCFRIYFKFWLCFYSSSFLLYQDISHLNESPQSSPIQEPSTIMV